MILGALRIIYHRRVSIRGWIERALLHHPRVCKPRRDKLRCVRLTEDTFLPRRGSPPPLVTSLNWRTRSIEKGSTRRSRGRGFVAIYRPYNAVHIEQANYLESVSKRCWKNINTRFNYSRYMYSPLLWSFRLYLNSWNVSKGNFGGRKSKREIGWTFEWKSVRNKKKRKKKLHQNFLSLIIDFRQLLRIKPYSKNTFVGHCTFIATVPIPELFECAVCMLCVCVCISRKGSQVGDHDWPWWKKKGEGLVSPRQSVSRHPAPGLSGILRYFYNYFPRRRDR